MTSGPQGAVTNYNGFGRPVQTEQGYAHTTTPYTAGAILQLMPPVTAPLPEDLSVGENATAALAAIAELQICVNILLEQLKTAGVMANTPLQPPEIPEIPE